MATATAFIPTDKARIAKYSGTCATCKGPIVKGVSWIRGSRATKGTAWHDGTCYDNRPSETASETVETNAVPSETLKPVTAKPVSSNTGDGFLGGLADAILPFLEGRIASKVDESTVKALIGDALKNAVLTTVTRVETKRFDESEWKDCGIQHVKFADLLQACSATLSDGHHLNVWTVGPAGSGKTTAAANVAKALGLPFYFIGSIDTQYALSGFMDANGKVVYTPFRKAYENGGVFLFDEVDGSSPNAVLAFNAALANGHCAFPDGVVERHKDFVCIAAANTWGLGATNDYVGRMKQDAAFLDRFVQCDWSIDEALETATCPNPTWVKRVQSVRKRIKDLGVKVIVSPRASYFGAALLAAGMSQTQVEKMTLRKAMTDEQWQSVGV
jgi:hypothetical protein